MKTKKKIFFPILAICAFMAIGVGATYALFTSSDKADIAVTAGKVKVSASVKQDSIKLFSAFDATLPTTGYNFETIQVGTEEVKYTQLDEFGNIYYSQIMDGHLFRTNGFVTYSNGVMSLTNVVPGDKTEFTIDFDNSSNVDVKYRIVVECIDEEEQNLKFFSKLHFGYGEEDLTGVRKYATDWILAASPSGVPTPIEDQSVSLKLPLTEGNELQSNSCNIRISIEAVQANAHVEGVAEKLIVDFDETVVTKDDDQKLEDVNLEAGITEEPSTSEEKTLCEVFVPLSSNKIASQVGEETYPVQVDDTLKLSVVQKEEIEEGFVVVPSNTSVLSFDVSLKNQEGEKIVSTEENIEVRLYVGLGRSIEGVYHNGDAVTNYTYENGVITIYTNSFSEYAVTYYNPEELEGVCRIGNNFYNTLKEGCAALKDGEKLTVFKNTAEYGYNNDCFVTYAKHCEICVLDGVTVSTNSGPQAFLICGESGSETTFSGRGKIVVSGTGTFANRGGQTPTSMTSGCSGTAIFEDISIIYSVFDAYNDLVGDNGGVMSYCTVNSGNFKNVEMGDIVYPDGLIKGGKFSTTDCLNYLPLGKAVKQLDGTDGYLYEVQDLTVENAGCYIEYEKPAPVQQQSAKKFAGKQVSEPIVVEVGDMIRKYYSTAKVGLVNLASDQDLYLLSDGAINGVTVQSVSDATIHLNGHTLKDTINSATGSTPGQNGSLIFKDCTDIVIDGGQANSMRGKIVADAINRCMCIALQGVCSIEVNNVDLVSDCPQSSVVGVFNANSVIEFNNVSMSAVHSVLFDDPNKCSGISINSGEILNNQDEAIGYIKSSGTEVKYDQDGKLVIEEHASGAPYNAKITDTDGEDRIFFSGEGASRNAILNVQNGETAYISENVTLSRQLPKLTKIYIKDISSEGASWVSGASTEDGYELYISYDEPTKTYTIESKKIVVCTLTHSGVTTEYSTLLEAIAAAESNVGDVIKMKKDVTYNSSITINKALTLDLNGHNITFTKGNLISHTSSKMTYIKDTSGTPGMIYAMKSCAVQKGTSSGAKGQLTITNVILKSDTTYAVDITIGCCYLNSGTYIGKAGTNAINAGWSVNATYFVQVNGGTYSSNISTISKTGFSITKSVVDNGDGTWTVK